MTNQTTETTIDNAREAQDQAASDLSLRIVDLLNLALRSSGHTQKDLADLVGVGDSRVSQVLHGDGNIHIATFARYLRALGYEARVSVHAADAEARPFVEPTPRKRRERKHARPATENLHIIHQPYVDNAGASVAFTLVSSPSDYPDGWLGSPIRITTIQGETKEVTHHEPRVSKSTSAIPRVSTAV